MSGIKMTPTNQRPGIKITPTNQGPADKYEMSLLEQAVINEAAMAAEAKATATAETIETTSSTEGTTETTSATAGTIETTIEPAA